MNYQSRMEMMLMCLETLAALSKSNDIDRLKNFF